MLSPTAKSIQVLESRRIELRRQAKDLEEVKEIDLEYKAMIQRIKDGDEALRTLAEMKRAKEVRLDDKQTRAIGALTEVFDRKVEDIDVNTISGLFKLIINAKYEMDCDGYLPYSFEIIDNSTHFFMAFPYLTRKHGYDKMRLISAMQNEASRLMDHELAIISEKERENGKKKK